jgi:flagellar hook assembly protein FlgD
VVLSIDNEILDFFTYDKNMQHELLEDVEGVSLERIESQSSVWHSAASSQNYGTPGYENSQNLGAISEECFSVEPQVFTPDFDGYKDITVISYNLDNSGYVGNIVVYNLIGTKIKTLATNSILDVKGEFIWDGTSDDGGRANIGYYIVLFELDMNNGAEKKLKKTVALGAQFN